jgi:uncharacterized protein (UPF0248 family)
MIPIHEMLNRIRWDKNYASADFSIGYYDRLEDEIIIVPFVDVVFDEEDKFAFYVMDNECDYHHVPFHRVKSVFRDGLMVWHRQH